MQPLIDRIAELEQRLAAIENGKIQQGMTVEVAEDGHCYTTPHVVRLGDFGEVN